MSEPLKVYCLITIPKPEYETEALMVFDTIRVGFPTAKLTFYCNALTEDQRVKVEELCKKVDAGISVYFSRIHHADWIEELTVNNPDNRVPFLITDPDVIFFEKMEDDFVQLPPVEAMAGRPVPWMWNEFAGTWSMSRLHTALMWLNPQRINKFTMAYQLEHGEWLDYAPIDLFRPHVQCVEGIPYFYDTTSSLFHTMGGIAYGMDIVKKFAHVNSSAFYDVMLQRVEDKKAFMLQHKMAREKNYEWFRDYWKAEEKYYQHMHKVGHARMAARQQQTRGNGKIIVPEKKLIIPARR